MKIFTQGLVSGGSNFCIVEDSGHEKLYEYDKETNKFRCLISDAKYIMNEGLVNGTSNYIVTVTFKNNNDILYEYSKGELKKTCINIRKMIF